MSNIYTKTGDKGTTGLYGGSRVDKDSLNVDAYGTVDEAISSLGVAYTLTDSPEIKEYINHIQKRMFQAGAELASDARGMEMLKDKIGEADIKYLENIIDKSTEVNGLMREFVVPGVNPSSAALHVSRTIVRRAERIMTALAKTGSCYVRSYASISIVYPMHALQWLVSKRQEQKIRRSKN